MGELHPQPVPASLEPHSHIVLKLSYPSDRSPAKNHAPIQPGLDAVIAFEQQSGVPVAIRLDIAFGVNHLIVDLREDRSETDESVAASVYAGPPGALDGRQWAASAVVRFERRDEWMIELASDDRTSDALERFDRGFAPIEGPEQAPLPDVGALL